MNIKPLADRVLIKPAPAEEKTAGGIIIPDTAKENHCKAKCLLLVMAQRTKKWCSRLATPCCMVNMPAPR